MNNEPEDKQEPIITAINSVNKTYNNAAYFTNIYPLLRQTQIDFLAAYVQNDFHIGKACLSCNIGRYTFNDWQKNDKVFLAAYNDTKQLLIDAAESCILKAIEQMDVKSAQFILKTIGKDRGYKESIELPSMDNLPTGAVINILSIKSNDDE